MMTKFSYSINGTENVKGIGLHFTLLHHCAALYNANICNPLVVFIYSKLLRLSSPPCLLCFGFCALASTSALQFRTQYPHTSALVFRRPNQLFRCQCQRSIEEKPGDRQSRSTQQQVRPHMAILLL